MSEASWLELLGTMNTKESAYHGVMIVHTKMSELWKESARKKNSCKEGRKERTKCRQTSARLPALALLFLNMCVG